MSKIVMANIKMPILVQNGSLQPMSEYIKIQIEQCADLPEKNQDTDGSIMDKINRILSEQNKDPEEETTVSKPDTELKIIVTKDELLESKPKKHRKNLSLKNTSKTMSRYTMKAYEKPSSSNTSSAGPSLLQEALELGSEGDQSHLNSG
jgi:hypothetical protein